MLCWYTTVAWKPTIAAGPGHGYIDSRNPGCAHDHLQCRRGKEPASLPDRQTLEGDEVVITRHGKPVAELRPRRQIDVKAARAMTEWLISRRHKDVGITSVELLDRIYEEDNQR